MSEFGQDTLAWEKRDIWGMHTETRMMTITLLHATKSQTIGITGREKGLQDDWMAHQEVKCEVCWRWSLQRLPCFFGHLHASSKFPNVKWKRYTASQKTLSLSYRAAWLQNMIGRNRPIDYNLHGSWPQKNCTTVQNFQCVDPSRHCLDL